VKAVHLKRRLRNGMRTSRSCQHLTILSIPPRNGDPHLADFFLESKLKENELITNTYQSNMSNRSFDSVSIDSPCGYSRYTYSVVWFNK
jgi:hypothetical protein